MAARTTKHCVLILLSQRNSPLICRHCLTLHDINVMWFKLLCMISFLHSYLLISIFMVTLCWLSGDIGYPGPTINHCRNSLWKLSSPWITFLSCFIYQVHKLLILCPLRTYSILQPQHHTALNQNTSKAHLHCHYQNLDNLLLC